MNDFSLQLQLPNPERQNRAITFFKWILVIPWFIWLYIWNIAFELLVILAWFILLFTGKWPAEFFSFATSYFRYLSRVSAWLMNLTAAWPPWHGRPDDDYGLILNIDRKEHYNRWKTGFRLILMIPLAVLEFGLVFYGIFFWFLGFWAILFTGRLPHWCRKPLADSFVMYQRIEAYMSLLVEEWPPLRGEDQIGVLPDEQSFDETAKEL